MTKVISTRLLDAPIVLATVLAAAIATSGCTKKAEVSYINVTLPKAMPLGSNKASAPGELRSISRSVSAQSDDSPDWNTSLNPTSGSQLNCFAVFVGGPNLTGNSCTVSDNANIRRIDFGPNLGFVPAGSVVRLEVPSGPDRVFHVVGLQASAASACSSYSNVEINASQLSEPFLIASQRANIPAGESSLDIVATLDLNKKIQTCSFVNGGGDRGSEPNINFSFGDERDGTLTQSSGSAWYYPAYNPYSTPSPGMAHTPKSGGVSTDKTGSAMRQVTLVATTGVNAGREIGTVSPFSNLDFDVGDEVMWYVSGGEAIPGPPDDPVDGACGGDLYLGRFGFGRIQSVPNSTSMVLDTPITATPAQVKTANLSAAMNSGNHCRISVQRVMNLENIVVASGASLSIVAASYSHSNGVGGILPIRVKELQVDGTLNLQANSTGYMGASGQAYSGGSIWGDNRASNGGASGNGGGSSNISNSSGGGGAGAGEGGGSSQGTSTMAIGGTPLAHGQDTSLTSLSMGANHACALADGKLLCWGGGLEGQGAFHLSSASFPPLRRTVPTLANTTLRFKQVASGYFFSCGISQTDQVYCWGAGSYGQLGNGSIGVRTVPTIIADSSSYSKIAVSSTSGAHACGILAATRELRCWGWNSDGQVGDGTTTNRSSPVTVDPGIQYADISVNHGSTCGVTTSGQLRCWGKNDYGQFGTGSTGTVSSPAPAGTGLGFKQVSVGYDFVCGITASDTAACSGRNFYGNLGDSTNNNRTTFSNIMAAGTFRQVATALGHACAINSSGSVYCWGDGANGQLGVGDTTGRLTPELLTGITLSSITAADVATCGISTSGTSFCWGGGIDGQLGIGSIQNFSSPQRVRTQQYTLPLTSRKLYFGGGGGGGDAFAGFGGTGGGFVFLMANRVRGVGTVNLTASGGNGTPSSGMSGGGGAGGVISATIRRSEATPTINILATGGTGASGASAGPSGGGGGGAAEVYMCLADTPATINANMQGGLGGDQSTFGDRGIFQSSDLNALCKSI